MAIWRDLVDDHGFTARYASVRRFVASLRATTPIEARVVITTEAGIDGQVSSARCSCCDCRRTCPPPKLVMFSA